VIPKIDMVVIGAGHCKDWLRKLLAEASTGGLMITY